MPSRRSAARQAPASAKMRGVEQTPDSAERLASLVEQLKIKNIRRHIFLCADQTKPACATKEEGLASWDYLKRRLEELGLTRAEHSVYRTKANCLRICQQGPIAVVYPDGTWYHSVHRPCWNASFKNISSKAGR